MLHCNSIMFETGRWPGQGGVTRAAIRLSHTKCVHPGPDRRSRRSPAAKSQSARGAGALRGALSGATAAAPRRPQVRDLTDRSVTLFADLRRRVDLDGLGRELLARCRATEREFLADWAAEVKGAFTGGDPGTHAASDTRPYHPHAR